MDGVAALAEHDAQLTGIATADWQRSHCC